MRLCVRNPASGYPQNGHKLEKWQCSHNLLTWTDMKSSSNWRCFVSLINFRYWSNFHVNIIAGSRVMTNSWGIDQKTQNWKYPLLSFGQYLETGSPFLLIFVLWITLEPLALNFLKSNRRIREFSTKTIIALHIFCNRLKYFLWSYLVRYYVFYKSYLNLLMMGYLYVLYEFQINLVFQNNFRVGLGKIS